MLYSKKESKRQIGNPTKWDRHRERETEEQTDKQTDRHIDKETDIQI